MGNSRFRVINYKPRLTQFEAYDLLPEPIQRVLQEGPTQWDTYSVLRWYRKQIKNGRSDKMAIAGAVNMINGWHQHEIKRTRSNPWGPKSPHKMAGATMQMSRS
jgi:hypothetical protein